MKYKMITSVAILLAALSAARAQEHAYTLDECIDYAISHNINVGAARKYSRFAMEKGYIPIAPHLLFPQFMDDSDPVERKLGLFFGTVIMSKCSEIWVFGNTISCGMAAEIKRARWRNYRVRYFTEDLEEITNA